MIFNPQQSVACETRFLTPAAVRHSPRGSPAVAHRSGPIRGVSARPTRNSKTARGNQNKAGRAAPAPAIARWPPRPPTWRFPGTLRPARGTPPRRDGERGRVLSKTSRSPGVWLTSPVKGAGSTAGTRSNGFIIRSSSMHSASWTISRSRTQPGGAAGQRPDRRACSRDSSGAGGCRACGARRHGAAGLLPNRAASD